MNELFPRQRALFHTAAAVIEVQSLRKRYGALTAVDGISFSIGRGEVVGFLGPNGAGKTTTLRIIAGSLGATSGSVAVAGHDVFDEPLRARKTLGYLPETCPLYTEMRVGEYLRYRAQLKRVGWRGRRAEAERVAKLALIDDWSDVLIAHLSRGLRQRVGLADALLGAPPILILDEPTAGLDPNQIREVRHLIRQLGQEHTVLLSTHILKEVESTCDRVLVIDRGKLCADGTLDELRARQIATGASLLVALGTASDDSTAGDASPARSDFTARLAEEVTDIRDVSLSRVAGGDGAHRLDVTFVDRERGVGALERVVAFLVRRGVGVRDVRRTGAELEDVFTRLTQHSPEEQNTIGAATSQDGAP